MLGKVIQTVEILKNLYEFQRLYIMPYLLAGGTIIAIRWLLHWMLHNMRRRGRGSIQAPANTAVIYQFPRGPYAPSVSPFAIKLETYCRVAKIPYVVDLTSRFSSHDKIPWIAYNGEIVEDSQFCIWYLNEAVGVDLNNHLDVDQKAVARMIQVLVDQHLVFTLSLFRFIHHDKNFPDVVAKELGMSKYKLWLNKRIIRNETVGQGLGRLTKEEVNCVMMEELKCLSNFLGEKPYMLGDRICEADCSVFGLLSQFTFHHFNSLVLQFLLENNFPSLHQYVLRIKEEIWPDWTVII